MIEFANINIVFDNFREINLPLSQTQLEAVLVVLGITKITPDEYRCNSDQAVKQTIALLKKGENKANE